jgi:hypothetical protein
MTLFGSVPAKDQRVPHISPRLLRGDVGNADLNLPPPFRFHGPFVELCFNSTEVNL